MKRTLLLIASASLMSAPAIAQELPTDGEARGECFARVFVPAQYGSATQIMTRGEDGTFEARTYKRPEQDTPRKPQWRQTLCETDASPLVIRAIQQALQQKGFYDAPPDGYLGNATNEAVKQFQISRYLSTGGLTMSTLRALGVDWRTINGHPQRNGGVSSGASPVEIFSKTGDYAIRADGSVRDSTGASIGKINGNGEVVANGVVIGRIRIP